VGSRWCARTMKYFRGVAMGLWIVTPEWIQACNDAGAWLPADDYEIVCGEHDDGTEENHGGPRRSRMQHARSDWDRPNGTSNLLEGMTLCLHGNFRAISLNTWDLKQLALMAGASVVATPKRRGGSQSSSSSSSSSSNQCDFVLCPKNTTASDAKRISQQIGVPVVSHTWLLDSIGYWRKQQPLDKKWILSHWKASSKRMGSIHPSP